MNYIESKRKLRGSQSKIEKKKYWLSQKQGNQIFFVLMKEDIIPEFTLTR